MDNKTLEIPNIKTLSKMIDKRIIKTLKYLENANKGKDAEHCYFRGKFQ